MIKITPRKIGPYKDLVLEKVDRENIHKLMTIMAEENVFRLYQRQTELRELGNRLGRVHPLRMLEVIFTDQYLIDCLKAVFDSYLKRTNFVDGIGQSLTTRSKMKDIEPYYKDFCKAIQAKEQELRPFFDSLAWEELLRFLMDRGAVQ